MNRCAIEELQALVKQWEQEAEKLGRTSYAAHGPAAMKEACAYELENLIDELKMEGEL